MQTELSLLFARTFDDVSPSSGALHSSAGLPSRAALRHSRPPRGVRQSWRDTCGGGDSGRRRDMHEVSSTSAHRAAGGSRLARVALGHLLGVAPRRVAGQLAREPRLVRNRCSEACQKSGAAPCARVPQRREMQAQRVHHS